MALFNVKMIAQYLYKLKTNTTTTIIILYLDDLLLARNNLSTIMSIKDKLKSHFNITNLGELKYFLGLVTKTR